MSLARKILENTFIQVFGKLITAGLSIVILRVISDYLGTSGYGDYTLIYQFLAFFGIVADFGIYTIAIKEMSKDFSRIPIILGNVMGLRTFLAVLAMIAAILSIFLIPSYQGTVIPIGVAIATLTTIITLLNGTITTVLQVHLKMHYASLSLVVGKIVTVLYMIWVIFYLFPNDLVSGFYHLILAGFIGSLVMYFITAFYVRRFTKITYQFDYEFWKEIFITSLPFGVALILNTIYFRLDTLLLSNLLPHSNSFVYPELTCKVKMCSDNEIGLYGVAMKFLEMLLIIPVYFMNSVLPIMTRYIEEKSVKLHSLLQYSFDFLMATALPILVGGFILSASITRLISSEGFLSGFQFEYGSDLAMQILMFAMTFSFLNALFGLTLVVTNHQKKLMYINGVAVLFNLIGNFLVIPAYGFRGAAFTSVISEWIILIFLFYVSKKLLNFHLKFITFLKTIFSALVMGGFILIVKDLLIHFDFKVQLAILVPMGGLIYVFLMFKTKAVTSEMIALLRKKRVD